MFIDRHLPEYKVHRNHSSLSDNQFSLSLLGLTVRASGWPVHPSYSGKVATNEKWREVLKVACSFDLRHGLSSVYCEFARKVFIWSSSIKQSCWQDWIKSQILILQAEVTLWSPWGLCRSFHVVFWTRGDLWFNESGWQLSLASFALSW